MVHSAAYGLNGQWDEAAADGQKCVSLAPQFLKGYHRASNALKHLKKYDEAIKTIEKGLIHFQGEPSALRAVPCSPCSLRTHAAIGRQRRLPGSASRGGCPPPASGAYRSHLTAGCRLTVFASPPSFLVLSSGRCRPRQRRAGALAWRATRC